MIRKQDIQKSQREWLLQAFAYFKHPFLMTLTFKEAIQGWRGLMLINAVECNKNLRHFLNILHRALLGRRHKHRMFTIPVLEQDQSGRFHYHVILDSPIADQGKLQSLVSEKWPRTQWGHKQVDVTPADTGSIDYVTKLRSKRDYDEAFDYANAHLPSGTAEKEPQGLRLRERTNAVRERAKPSFEGFH